MDSTEILSESADSYGEILNAYLVLFAFVVLINPLPKKIKYKDNAYGLRATTTIDGVNNGTFYPETLRNCKTRINYFAQG